MGDGPGQYGPHPSDGVVPFSIVNWSPFRLSRCRWGVQSGPLFGYQVVPFSFDKNNRCKSSGFDHSKCFSHSSAS